MGRDMNSTGTDIAGQTQQLLDVARAHHKATGDPIVVAAGYNPDFPDQTESFASMMATYLRNQGVSSVIVLQADHFSSYGELEALHAFCMTRSIERVRIIGFTWHLWRVMVEAGQIDKDWVQSLKVHPVPGLPGVIDVCNEPFKWFKLALPRPVQVKCIEFWKKNISKRTSY